MRRLLWIAIGTLLIGCTGATVTPQQEMATISLTPTQTETDQPTEEISINPQETALPTVEPTLIPTIAGTAIPERPLDADGPWLIVIASADQTSKEGLWALNADGTGLTQISQETVARFNATQSGRVAYVTSTGDDWLSGLVLNVVQLPDPTPILTLPLTSERTAYVEGPSQQEDQPDTFEIGRAITESNSMAWSPDGSTLAFVGAMNGDSADIYSYSIDTNTLLQLSSGELQAADPTWSPDGRYVVHEAVRSFGTGAGAGIDSVWAAKSDGSGSIKMYALDETSEIFSGGEIFRHWVDADHLLVYSWNALCGDSQIRTVSLSGTMTMLWQDCFDVLAIDYDTETYMVVVSYHLGEFIIDSGGSSTGGIYLVNGSTGEVKQVSTVDAASAEWSNDVGGFIVTTQENTELVFDQDGNLIREQPSNNPFAIYSYFYQLSFDKQFVMISQDNQLWVGSAPDYTLTPVNGLYLDGLRGAWWIVP